MKKLITMIAMALGSVIGFAAGPQIEQCFVINGRLMFKTSSDVILQRKSGSNWVTESGLRNSEGFWLSPDKDYSGIVEIRFGTSGSDVANPDDWTTMTIDARYPVAPVEVWDDCNHSTAYWQDPALALDGDPSTYFHVSDGYQWSPIYYDLGSAKTIIGGAAMSRNGFPGRIGTAVFEGSNDESFGEGNVVVLGTIPEGDSFSDRYESFTFETPATVRYVRLRPNGGNNVPGWDGWFNVSELEFVEKASDLDVTVGDLAMDDGVVTGIPLTIAGLADSDEVYVAYGPNPVADGGYEAWAGSAKLDDVTNGEYTFTEFPTNWGTDEKYIRFFVLNSDKVTLLTTDIIACDGTDFPIYRGAAAIAGNTYGDTIVVSGSMRSAGSGEGGCIMTVEVSSSEDFTDRSVWTATLDDGFSYRAVLHDVNPESPSYLEAGATYYVRVKAADGNGHVVYSPVAKMDVGVNFNKGPQLDQNNPPTVVNGRLCVPLAGGRLMYMFQKLADDGETWVDVPNFGENYTNLYSPDQSLRGVSTWRVAYTPTAPGVTEPSFWTEFTVDAKYPIFGKTLCVGGVYDGNISESGAYDGYYFSYYEPNASAYDTENMWVGYDFGSVRTITGIRYARRQDNNGVVGSIFQFADNPDFEDAVTLDYTVGDPGGNWAVSVPEEHFPFSARYVRIKMPRGGWFNVGEVEYDVAADDADIMVENAGGFPDGKPLVSVSPRYSPENGFCIYRSRKPNGGFALVATLDGGVTEWTDNDSSLKYGVPYYYTVAKRNAAGEPGAREVQVRPITLYRWLEGREAYEAFPGINTGIANGEVFCLETVSACYPTTNRVYYIFDDDVNTIADFYYNTPGNPRIGVDFGADPVHVARFMLYPRVNYFHRSMGLTLHGSNSDSYDSETIIDAGVPLSKPTADVNAMSWFTFESDSTDAYRVLFLKTNDGWCGGLGELRFYGYTDKDIGNGGMRIFVR